MVKLKIFKNNKFIGIRTFSSKEGANFYCKNILPSVSGHANYTYHE